MKLSREQHVKAMLKNLSAAENQGLSYAIQEGYITPTTGNQELNEAILKAKENLDLIQSEFSKFEDELDLQMCDDILE